MTDLPASSYDQLPPVPATAHTMVESVGDVDHPPQNGSDQLEVRHPTATPRTDAEDVLMGGAVESRRD